MGQKICDRIKFCELTRSTNSRKDGLCAEVQTAEWIPWHTPNENEEIIEKKPLRTIDLLVARTLGKWRRPRDEVVG